MERFLINNACVCLIKILLQDRIGIKKDKRMYRINYKEMGKRIRAKERNSD